MNIIELINALDVWRDTWKDYPENRCFEAYESYLADHYHEYKRIQKDNRLAIYWLMMGFEPEGKQANWYKLWHYVDVIARL